MSNDELEFGFKSTDRFQKWIKLLGIDESAALSKLKPVFGDYVMETDAPVNKERVIRQDVLRTRGDETFFRTSTVRSLLKQSLVKYCAYYNVQYMQGINEILAPILTIVPAYEVHLKEILEISQGQEIEQSTEVEEQLSELVFERYNIALVLFERLMARLCPTLFSTKGLDALQAQMASFHLILTYHDPILSTIFRKQAMTPEIYAMPWFITLFARRMPIFQVLHMWDILLQLGRPHFVIFIGIALLLSHREQILRDYSEDLPEILVSLQFKDTHEIDRCVRRALLLEQATPRCMIGDIVSVVFDKALHDDARESGVSNLWHQPCVLLSAQHVAEVMSARIRHVRNKSSHSNNNNSNNINNNSNNNSKVNQPQQQQQQRDKLAHYVLLDCRRLIHSDNKEAGNVDTGVGSAVSQGSVPYLQGSISIPAAVQEEICGLAALKSELIDKENDDVLMEGLEPWNIERSFASAVNALSTKVAAVLSLLWVAFVTHSTERVHFIICDDSVTSFKCLKDGKSGSSSYNGSSTGNNGSSTGVGASGGGENRESNSNSSSSHRSNDKLHTLNGGPAVDVHIAPASLRTCYALPGDQRYPSPSTSTKTPDIHSSKYNSRSTVKGTSNTTAAAAEGASRDSYKNSTGEILPIANLSADFASALIILGFPRVSIIKFEESIENECDANADDVLRIPQTVLDTYHSHNNIDTTTTSPDGVVSKLQKRRSSALSTAESHSLSHRGVVAEDRSNSSEQQTKVISFTARSSSSSSSSSKSSSNRNSGGDNDYHFSGAGGEVRNRRSGFSSLLYYLHMYGVHSATAGKNYRLVQVQANPFVEYQVAAFLYDLRSATIEYTNIQDDFYSQPQTPTDTASAKRGNWKGNSSATSSTAAVTTAATTAATTTATTTATATATATAVSEEEASSSTSTGAEGGTDNNYRRTTQSQHRPVIATRTASTSKPRLSYRYSVGRSAYASYSFTPATPTPFNQHSSSSSSSSSSKSLEYSPVAALADSGEVTSPTLEAAAAASLAVAAVAAGNSKDASVLVKDPGCSTGAPNNSIQATNGLPNNNANIADPSNIIPENISRNSPTSIYFTTRMDAKLNCNLDGLFDLLRIMSAHKKRYIVNIICKSIFHSYVPALDRTAHSTHQNVRKSSHGKVMNKFTGNFTSFFECFATTARANAVDRSSTSTQFTTTATAAAGVVESSSVVPGVVEANALQRVKGSKLLPETGEEDVYRSKVWDLLRLRDVLAHVSRAHRSDPVMEKSTSKMLDKTKLMRSSIEQNIKLSGRVARKLSSKLDFSVGRVQNMSNHTAAGSKAFIATDAGEGPPDSNSISTPPRASLGSRASITASGRGGTRYIDTSMNNLTHISPPSSSRNSSTKRSAAKNSATISKTSSLSSSSFASPQRMSPSILRAYDELYGETDVHSTVRKVAAESYDSPETAVAVTAATAEPLHFLRMYEHELFQQQLRDDGAAGGRDEEDNDDDNHNNDDDDDDDDDGDDDDDDDNNDDDGTGEEAGNELNDSSDVVQVDDDFHHFKTTMMVIAAEGALGSPTQKDINLLLNSGGRSAENKNKNKNNKKNKALGKSGSRSSRGGRVFAGEASSDNSSSGTEEEGAGGFYDA